MMSERDLRATLAADRGHVWHPYTPMDEWRAHHAPLVVTSARGSWLELADGRRLLDGNGQWWVSTLGHNHPRLVAALKAQAEQLCHVSLAGITHPAAARFAEELASVAPKGLTEVFFSDDGSTAVEAAVKMVVQYQRQIGHPERSVFLALGNAFHGETVGATSLGGVEVFRRPFAPVLFEVVHLAPPADLAALPQALRALEAAVGQQGPRLAGAVVEPLLQGAAGMQTYPAAYLNALRDACTRTGALLVADEVFTGYGRLGTMWGCDRANVVPDLLCTAKGFTAGVLPMAATLATAEVLAAFSGGRARAFLYGHSYGGNPLGAAVGREVLKIYRDEGVLAGVAVREERLRAGFEALARDPLAGRLLEATRVLGSVGAADLRAGGRRATTVRPVETEADLGEGYVAEVGWRVYEEALERGAYLRPLGNVVYLSPALNIPLPELDQLLEILRESVRAVAGEMA